MTYLKRSKRPGNGKFVTAIVVGALVVIFGINYFFPSAYPTIFFPVASVFWKSESSTGGWLSNMGAMVQSKYALIQENNRLAAEIASRDKSMLVLDALKAENANLLKALGRVGKGDYAVAAVLSRPPVSPYDTLVLDAGSNDGVKVGDRVYADGDILIGDISDVFSNQSKASLFSTPNRTTSVLVGTSTVSAEATGRGSGNFIFRLPAQTPLVVGASIRIPGIKARAFGFVENIMVDSSDSLQTVLFKSPVNINELDFVEIEK